MNFYEYSNVVFDKNIIRLYFAGSNYDSVEGTLSFDFLAGWESLGFGTTCGKMVNGLI